MDPTSPDSLADLLMAATSANTPDNPVALPHLPELSPAPLPDVLPPETPTPAYSSRGEVTTAILEACGLQDSLGHSVCLTCQNLVMAQDARNRATLYCSALFRDLETSITACTSHLPA